MKFYVNGTDLAAATNIVSKALAANKSIPILEGIKIEARGTTLTLSAYNQELYIEKTIPAEILLEGICIVGGKLFTEYANKIYSTERISIEKSDGKRLNIGFDGSDANIQYYDVENFPLIGEYDEENSFQVKENDLRELIDKSIYCVSTSDNRMTLKSCKLELENDIITAVCSDGYRLAFTQKAVTGVKGSFKSNILGKILSDISKSLNDSEEYIKVCKYRNMVIFDLGHTKIRTTTVEGEFINYKNVLPKTINNEIIVNKQDLESCLSRASIINRDINLNKVKITVEDNVMNIFAEGEQGNVKENINCTNSGEKIVFGVSSKYLSDAIGRIKEDFVKIQLDSPIKPICIKQIDGNDYMSIVLPVRLVS